MRNARPVDVVKTLQRLARRQGPSGVSFGGGGAEGDPGRDAGLAYSFDTSTSMADPGTGDVRFNNGTIASVTAIAISDTDDEGNDQDGFLDTWDDSTSTVKGLLIISTADGQVIVFEVTAISDQGTWHQATVVHRSGALPSNDEALSVLFVRTGDKGDTGATGSTGSAGATGAAGLSAGFRYLFDSTTSSGDPGSGDLRINNGTFASATQIYISETDANSASIAAFLATIDDSTSTVKGHILIREIAAPGDFVLFSISGAITDNGSWVTIPVTYITGAGGLNAADPLSVQFTRTGDKGDTGATGAAGTSASEAVYRTILQANGWTGFDQTAATFLIGAGKTENDMRLQASGSSVYGTAPPIINFDDADFEVSGLTKKLRLRVVVASNATAPAITFTFGLYPLTVAGGADALTYTAGTVVTGSTVAVASPSASTLTRSNTSDFDIPADGSYALGVVTSGTIANNSMVSVHAQLQMRNV